MTEPARRPSRSQDGEEEASVTPLDSRRHIEYEATHAGRPIGRIRRRLVIWASRLQRRFLR